MWKISLIEKERFSRVTNFFLDQSKPGALLGRSLRRKNYKSLGQQVFLQPDISSYPPILYPVANCSADLERGDLASELENFPTALLQGPPESWREALQILSEALGYGYDLTVRRWGPRGLMMGLWHIARLRAPCNHTALEVYNRYKASPLNTARRVTGLDLRGLDLWEMRYLLALCYALSHERTRHGFLRTSGLHNRHVLLLDLQPGALRPAFAVVLDERTRSILILVRGTYSSADRLTVLAGRSMQLTLTLPVPDNPASTATVKGHVHAGMVAAARWLLDHTEGILEAAAVARPDWNLMCVGHSLGGGTAALLAMLLRAKACTAAPTGAPMGPLSRPTATAFAAPCCMTGPLGRAAAPFVTSVIHADDLVPTLSAHSLDLIREDVFKRADDAIRTEEDCRKQSRADGETENKSKAMPPPGVQLPTPRAMSVSTSTNVLGSIVRGTSTSLHQATRCMSFVSRRCSASMWRRLRRRKSSVKDDNEGKPSGLLEVEPLSEVRPPGPLEIERLSLDEGPPVEKAMLRSSGRQASSRPSNRSGSDPGWASGWEVVREAAQVLTIQIPHKPGERKLPMWMADVENGESKYAYVARGSSSESLSTEVDDDDDDDDEAYLTPTTECNSMAFRTSEDSIPSDDPCDRRRGDSHPEHFLPPGRCLHIVRVNLGEATAQVLRHPRHPRPRRGSEKAGAPQGVKSMSGSKTSPLRNADPIDVPGPDHEDGAVAYLWQEEADEMKHHVKYELFEVSPSSFAELRVCGWMFRDHAIARYCAGLRQVLEAELEESCQTSDVGMREHIEASFISKDLAVLSQSLTMDRPILPNTDDKTVMRGVLGLQIIPTVMAAARVAFDKICAGHVVTQAASFTIIDLSTFAYENFVPAVY
ncbi:hypothetical protein CYMTET_47537 [Cymbomonas tetramitiformis]|uniref:Fungal lipase-type domain-containing protein n=1 Tax=Cymbomonas tetramitiformis TaxID=36881 RepID=A0AAE0BU37_9CHLO|nr:hypothetical protein CYMTET_47537 [Cymbomonas tetramitiformis]